MTAHSHAAVPSLDVILLALAALATVTYAVGVMSSRRRGREWPMRRLASWAAGAAAATVSVVGPLAEASHGDFVAHMWAHLLGGMVAPLLLVLAAPVTLALRTLHLTPARRLSRLLKSPPVRFIAHPLTAAILSAGGLWVIYLTPVFEAMQSAPLIHVFVHGHLLLVGFVFLSAVIGVDPAPHAPRRMIAAIALVLSMASHAVLAKHLYAYPPAGVPIAAAQEGAQLMYYAGSLVEAVIVVIFCAQWYRAAGRRLDRAAPHRTVAAS